MTRATSCESERREGEVAVDGSGAAILTASASAAVSHSSNRCAGDQARGPGSG